MDDTVKHPGSGQTLTRIKTFDRLIELAEAQRAIFLKSHKFSHKPAVVVPNMIFSQVFRLLNSGEFYEAEVKPARKEAAEGTEKPYRPCIFWKRFRR